MGEDKEHIGGTIRGRLSEAMGGQTAMIVRGVYIGAGHRAPGPHVLFSTALTEGLLHEPLKESDAEEKTAERW